MEMSEIIASLGFWAWFILAIALFALEVMVPGVYFLWLGAAAFVVGGIVAMVDMSWQWQIACFALLSIVSVFLSRRFVKQDADASEAPFLNQRTRRFIGRECLLAEPIEQGTGRVHINDTYWSARGPDLPAGTKVKITGAEGNVLLVEPAAE
jgi:membrane protein implicated in regulation of membrane protease activity